MLPVDAHALLMPSARHNKNSRLIFLILLLKYSCWLKLELRASLIITLSDRRCVCILKRNQRNSPRAYGQTTSFFGYWFGATSCRGANRLHGSEFRDSAIKAEVTDLARELPSKVAVNRHIQEISISRYPRLSAKFCTLKMGKE